MVHSSGAALLQQQASGRLLLQGELSFSSVPGLLNEGKHLQPGSGGVLVDLQGVTRTDSAGLALMVEWTRNARAQGVDITFVNIPQQMMALIRLSGLEEVLSLAPATPSAEKGA